MMYADSDEFFDMDGAELLRRVEAYGGFVVGHMVDRIARDWTLRAYDGVPHLGDTRTAPLPRDVAAPRRRQHEVDPGAEGDRKRPGPVAQLALPERGT